MGKEGKRKILVIGGGFAGFVVARHFHKNFDVTVIDAKEYFEYTPGILRAFVLPSHLSALTFKYQPVLEGKMGCKFCWGEVTQLDGANRSATYKPMNSPNPETVNFDYCVVAAGCNFGLFHPKGESLWFPTVWEETRKVSSWKQHDERYLAGRLDHITEEFNKLGALNKANGSVLIVGAGFIGVEWATEIKHYFPNIGITLCDMLDACLGPLPVAAKGYCQKYLDKNKIVTKYGVKFDAFNPEGYKVLSITKPDIIYISTGFKASCWFMPKNCMSQYSALKDKNFEDDIKRRGPAGGGWIVVDKKLQVLAQKPDGTDQIWGADDKGYGRIFAVGDVNIIRELPPIPKISYPGEEQAAVACRNIETVEKLYYAKTTSGCYTVPYFWPICPLYGEHKMTDAWWPWGSGMFATSLGSHDACFVMAANTNPGSGYMVLWGRASAIQKWFIEWSKVDQCKQGYIGWMTWCMVH